MPLNLVTPGQDVPENVNVIIEIPLRSDPVIRCRPVGMLNMTDDGGPDAKILAVPIDSLTDLYRGVTSFRDLPGSMLAQIAHFFQHYKDLEPGTWVKVDGWLGPEEAKAEILACIARYQAEPEKPQF